jgi:hypothetical protein
MVTKGSRFGLPWLNLDPFLFGIGTDGGIDNAPDRDGFSPADAMLLLDLVKGMIGIQG